MRRPLSLNLPRGSLSAILVIGLSCALSDAHAQTSSPIPTNAPATVTSVDLPDSPGAVLRRRVQTMDLSSETASASGPATSLPDAPTPQQPASSSEAKASDTRRTGNCVSVPEAARSGIVEAKSNSPAGGNTEARSGPNPSSMPVSTQPPRACPPAQTPNPYQRFLNSGTPIPLTPKQKAYLAVHNFIDPGNLVTIVGTSGIAIASDSHTAYGPGWRGFGRDAGISAVEDATGDFFGTFLIPAIAHEDPHYHRMPNASIPRRTLHAISRTIIAQGDDGHAMPNYATLLTYPITAEIANLYVPGVATNGPSTVERVLTGYATDPIDNLITEFLPDVAKRIHVRVIFVQQIINQVAAGQPVTMFP